MEERMEKGGGRLGGRLYEWEVRREVRWEVWREVRGKVNWASV